MDVVQGLEGVSNLGGGLGGRDNSPEEVSFLPHERDKEEGAGEVVSGGPMIYS